MINSKMLCKVVEYVESMRSIQTVLIKIFFRGKNQICVSIPNLSLLRALSSILNNANFIPLEEIIKKNTRTLFQEWSKRTNEAILTSPKGRQYSRHPYFLKKIFYFNFIFFFYAMGKGIKQWKARSSWGGFLLHKLHEDSCMVILKGNVYKSGDLSHSTTAISHHTRLSGQPVQITVILAI